MTAKKTVLKVIKVSMINFKCIKDLTIDLNGNSVLLLAKNGRGKSTILQAIGAGLGFKELPPKPLKEGEKKGKIEVKFGDENNQYTSVVTFSEKNSKGTLTVTTSDNLRPPSPAKFLNDITGGITFDPLEFMNKSGSEKTKELKKLIHKLTGIDITELDSAYKLVFDTRADANKDIKRLDGEISSSQFLEDELDKYCEQKSIKELTDKIDYSNKLCNAIDRGNTVLENNTIRINTIDEALDRLEADKARIIGQSEETKTWLEGRTKPDVKALETELTQAIIHNENVSEAKRIKKSIADRETIKEKIDGYNTKLEEINKSKNEVFEKADIPIEGLTFENDMIYLDGLAIDENQIPTSKILEMGVRLSMACSPNMRIIRIKNGALLDDDMTKVILNLVEENDYQAFIEVVDRNEDELKIEIIETNGTKD